MPPEEASSPAPLVTVIMPVFNAGRTLAQAIRSVRDQDWPRLQFIAVDDGSTDDSLAVLARHGDAIEVLRQARQGPAAARNLAVRHARGQYLAFIDADDIWLPGKLRQQVAHLQAHPDVDAVFGRFERWEASSSGDFAEPPVVAPPGPTHEHVPQVVSTPRSQPGGLYVDLLLDSVVHIITAVIRTDALTRFGGFDESLATGSDYDFWLRFSRDHRLVQLDHVVAWYRIHPTSITKTPRTENAEYSILQRTMATHGLQGPDGRAVTPARMARRLFDIAFGHGYLLFWLGHWQRARPWFVRALGHRRAHPKVWVYVLLTLVWRQPPAWFATIIRR